MGFSNGRLLFFAAVGTESKFWGLVKTLNTPLEFGKNSRGRKAPLCVAKTSNLCLDCVLWCRRVTRHSVAIPIRDFSPASKKAHSAHSVYPQREKKESVEDTCVHLMPEPAMTNQTLKHNNLFGSQSFAPHFAGISCYRVPPPGNLT